MKRNTLALVATLLLANLAFAQTPVANDGYSGADLAYQGSSTTIVVNWDNFSTTADHMAITIYSNPTNIAGSTIYSDDSARIPYITRGVYVATGLSLTNGATYYTRVQSHDASHNIIQTAFTKGVTVDTTPPIAGTVYDGTTFGVQTSTQTSTTTISANWSGFSDPQSGITNYQWAIGTTPGGTDIQPFTNVGLATNASNTSLSLLDCTTYYTSVAASNNVPAFTAIAGGFEHTIALKSNGTVWTWGSNSNGQLGDMTNIDRSTPIQVATGTGVYLTDIIAIAGGGFHTIALKSDGTVWTWGYNGDGELGDVTTTDRNTPVQVATGVDVYLTDIIAIAGGGFHTIALKNDGTVWTWGYNGIGALGNGTNNDNHVPIQVIDPNDPTGLLTNIIAISGGLEHTIALKSDGTVWTWGDNLNGQLGDGTNDSSNIPVQVVDSENIALTDIVAISGGAYQTIALKNDGTVWTWGYNGGGELGDGTTTQRNNPVQVLGPGSVGNLTDVVAIAGGLAHTTVLKNDGTVWTWGNNYSTNTPVQVGGFGGVGYLTDIIAIAEGSYNYNTIALKSDGTLWTWWLNDSGQLGDGTNNNRGTPGHRTNDPTRVKIIGLPGDTTYTIISSQGVKVIVNGLIVNNGVASSGTKKVPVGFNDFTALRFFLSTCNNPVAVNSITFTASGSMNQIGLAAKLYIDVNNVGYDNANSILLGTVSYSNGQYIFSGAPLLNIPASTIYSCLLVYDTISASTIYGDTFGVSISSSSDISATQSVNGSFPMSSYNFVIGVADAIVNGSSSTPSTNISVIVGGAVDFYVNFANMLYYTFHNYTLTGDVGYTYNTPNTYPEIFTVYFANGATRIFTVNVTVNPTPDTPTISGAGASIDGVNYFTSLDGTNGNPASAGSASALVYFNANVTVASGRTIVYYVWDFGDGIGFQSSQTTSNALYIYPTGGTFTANLVILDNAGKSATATVVVKVDSNPNAPSQPTVNAIYKEGDGTAGYDGGDTNLDTNADGNLTIASGEAIDMGTTVSIDVSSTPAAGRTIKGFLWYLSNGSGVVTNSIFFSGVGNPVNIQFSDPGTNTLNVAAIDDKNSMSNIKTFTIDVKSPSVATSQIYWVQPNPISPKFNNRQAHSGSGVSLLVKVTPILPDNPPNVEFRYRDMGATEPTGAVATVALDQPAWQSGALNPSKTVIHWPYQARLDTTQLTQGHWYELAAFVDTNKDGVWEVGEPVTIDEFGKRVFISIPASGDGDVSEQAKERKAKMDLYSHNKSSLIGDDGKSKTDVTLPFGSLKYTNDDIDVTTLPGASLTITNSNDSDNLNPNQSISDTTKLGFVPGTLMNLSVSDIYGNSMKLDKAARVRIYYDPTNVAASGLNESDLVLYHYNSTSGQWEMMPNQLLSKAEHYVECDAPAFSPFALAGLAIAEAAGVSAGGGLGLGGLAAVALCGTTGFDAIIFLAFVYCLNRSLRRKESYKMR